MNKPVDIKLRDAALRGSPALLHEMMRSFTTLARTLNLSQAVEQLGSTRQTVRRHINQLEEAMQVRLFDVQQRRYSLTPEGTRAVAPAQMLLDQGEVWFRGAFDSVGGMLRFSHDDPRGWKYHQQEQPMSSIWTCRSKLLRTALQAWSRSEGHLESSELAVVRPYILAYREIADGWICTEVGESSYYSNWFGWAQARSSVGRRLSQFQGGQEFASLANGPFQAIKNNHGVRMDQVFMKMQMAEGEPFHHLVFDRLLMGVRMPDESPAIISVVDAACKIRILDLDEAILDDVPERSRVDFTL